MKKILTTIILLLTLFIMTDKVYAEEYPTIYDFNAVIEMDDDSDAIIITERFKVKNINDNVRFEKVYNNFKSLYIIDSNFANNYIPDYGVSDESDVVYQISDESQEYFLKYEAKNTSVKKGDKYKFVYTPIGFYGNEQEYEGINIVIKSTEKNPLNINNLLIENDKNNRLLVQEDGNIITIAATGPVNERFVISFDKTSHSTSSEEIRSIADHIMTIILIAMCTLTVMKVITGRSAISKVILILAIVGALLFVGTSAYDIITNPNSGMGRAGLFPLIFCVILYGVFYAVMFFNKGVGKNNRMADLSSGFGAVGAVVLTFPKLFICFHSLIMISGITGISNGFFDLTSNMLLLKLTIALFIGSYGYQYFDRDISNSQSAYKKMKF